MKRPPMQALPLPTCDGWCEHTGEVAMIDQAGFVYCEPCGMRRRDGEPCRKLRPHELNRLRAGKTIGRY